MICKRCGNKDLNYFYKGHKGIYCRKCIKFKRILLEEEIRGEDYEINENIYEYHFDYLLTAEQLSASHKCLNYLKDGDVLLQAICGAGKTEITIASISHYLKQRLKVCYAIARKEVVIELSKRFKEIFKEANVIAVYGNHHDILKGDLIVATCHQLFRYYQTFDLLIIDEVDAFPLANNDTLMNIVLNSSKGRIIFSTATKNNFLENILKKRKYQSVILNKRPSNKPLIIPKVKYNIIPLHLLYLLFVLINNKNQFIIFVPTIKWCKILYYLFKPFVNCTYVYADLDKRNNNIKAFRKKEYQYIFATSVLERGITIKDISVIILDFKKGIFDEASFVQMLGRVGRNINSQIGSAIILANHIDNNISKTLEYIKEVNKDYKMSIL